LTVLIRTPIRFETIERLGFKDFDTYLQASIGETEERSKRERDAIDPARENKKPQAHRGTNQHTLEDVTKSGTVTSSKRGIRRDYRIRRLRGSCPAAAERLEHGEFKSVSAAER
jgi:hypothetical protein